MWRDAESEHDFLNFTEVADQIATLATSPEILPVSIGVFGTWGTGKSTVLTLVERALHDSAPKPIIIKFDAWLYQGFDDAKAALMEVVADRLLEEAKSNEALFKKVGAFAARINYFRALGMAADVGVGMAFGVPPGLMTSAGTAIASLFSGKGDAEDSAAIKESGKAVADGWKKLIKPEEARTPPKEIAAFRSEFEGILKELGRPLILFIDNLDRCLPDVAIGTLEAIRLFLFIPGTAFVVAADEDMIRHSVSKHFSDPTARHVNDYLDKVIQVPMRVPQVGTEDVRAYMYSLFVQLYARDKLKEVQGYLLKALQDSWKGSTFDAGTVSNLASNPPRLLDALTVSDRLAPMLSTAPSIMGNPRITKRMLNALMLRETLAKQREMSVDLATLAKLAIFERSTNTQATEALYALVMSDETPEWIGPANSGRPSSDMPPSWKPFESFVTRWREMEPHFKDAKKLRPAVFLSRDVLAPSIGVKGLSAAATAAFAALLEVKSVNSPEGTKIVQALPANDQRAVMAELIASLRSEDWAASKQKGLHGAVLITKENPELLAEFKAFIASIPKLSNVTAALLRANGIDRERT